MGQTCGVDKVEAESDIEEVGSESTDSEEKLDKFESRPFCGPMCGLGMAAPPPSQADAKRTGLRHPLLQTSMMTRSNSFAVGQDTGQSYETTFPPLLERPRASIIVFIVLCFVGVVLSCTVFEDWFIEHGVSRGLLLEYVSIPFVSVIFTYFHIWLALVLTFYPLEYRGWMQIKGTNAGLGWQGIIPNRAGEMAAMSVDLMTKKLIHVPDIIAKIDVEEVIQLLEPTLGNNVIKVMDDAMSKEEPKLWTSIPTELKMALIGRAKRDAPVVVARIVEELKSNIERYFDVKEMVVGAFTSEPSLLNHMFIECGYTELVFIRNCGGYMGLFAGVLQVALWLFYSAGWMLPTFGFVVGILSNWLALKMIFEPVKPVKLCCCTIQGLFLTRQAQVADVYSQIVSDNVLSARNITKSILRGPLVTQLLKMLVQEMGKSMEQYLGPTWQGVKRIKSEQYLQRCRQSLADGVLQQMPSSCRHIEKYMSQAMALEDVLRTKMAELPPEQFERLLHPVFEQDEWKLVLMGGVLGVAVGCFQWWALGA